MNKFYELFITFFKIGIFTLGGGYSMIPLLEQEIVNNKKWISKNEFYNFFALETIVPGSVAVNMASFVGFHLYKIPGLLIATLGVILPSIITISILSHSLFKYKDNPYTKKIINVLKPTLLALVFITFIRLSINTKNNINYYYFLFFPFTFILIFFYHINPIFVILINIFITISLL